MEQISGASGTTGEIGGTSDASYAGGKVVVFSIVSSCINFMIFFVCYGAK